MAKRKSNTQSGSFLGYLILCFIIVSLIGVIGEWLHISFWAAAMVVISAPIVFVVAIILALFSAKALIKALNNKWRSRSQLPETPNTESVHIQSNPVNIAQYQPDFKGQDSKDPEGKGLDAKGSKEADARQIDIMRPSVKLYFNTQQERGGLGHLLSQIAQDCTILAITATGYGSDTWEIIELTAIKLRDLEPVDTFQSLIRPTKKLTQEWISKTGITNLMLSKAPGVNNVLPAFVDFLGDDVVVSFNTQSTMYFLYDLLLAYTDHVLSNNYLDIQRLAWKILPDIEPQKLSDISIRLGVSEGHSGRTMGQCEILASCYQLMAKISSEMPTNELQTECRNGTTLDELLVPAIDWIIDNNIASVSALRRKFGIGYSRAQSLMQQIELLGVIGPPQGNKQREVLMGINPLKD